MKKMKRILTLILTVCLLLPCFSIVSYAADGIIFFDDLDTTVGAKFKIKGTAVTKNDVIDDVSIEMTYDPAYVKFIQGEGVTKTSDGSLTFKGSGDGRSDRVVFTMEFQALKEGSMRIKQGAATVTNKAGRTVTCDSGYSDIKIGAGDPSLITDETSGSIEVNGVAYSVSSSFSDNVVPAGFTRGEIAYQDQKYEGIVHETASLQGLYLKDTEGVGAFYLYNASDASFYPCEEITISDEYSIVVLSDVRDVKVDPNKYVEAMMTINGTEFPAWSILDQDEYYLLYALSPSGEKSLYKYDSVEHTYQRVDAKLVQEPEKEKEEEVAKTKLEKVLAIIEKNLIWAVVGVACILVILFILIIVLAAKLRNRNLELDDLYDEYGIDLEDTPVPVKNTNTKSNKSAVDTRKEKYNEYYEDDDYDEDFDDDYEDDYEYEDEFEEDYEYEDDYEEDELENLRSDFNSKTVKERTKYDSYYDDDDYEEVYEDEREGLKQSVNTDTFEMDFIDFD